VVLSRSLALVQSRNLEWIRKSVRNAADCEHGGKIM
jgi:hypothetical protein